MTTTIENMFALWMWPLGAMRLANDLAETTAATQRVIAARLPIIASAFYSPLTADHRELGRMIDEKVYAIGASGRSIETTGEAVQRASSNNARAFGQLASYRWIRSDRWLRLAEGNIAALAALVTLPGAMLAPFHEGVVSNDKRLAG